MCQNQQRQWCDDERAPYIATNIYLIDDDSPTRHVSSLPYVKGILDMLDNMKYDMLWDEVEFCEYEFEPPVYDADDNDDDWYDAWVIDDNNNAADGDKPGTTTTDYTSFCFDVLVRHKTLYT